MIHERYFKIYRWGMTVRRFGVSFTLNRNCVELIVKRVVRGRLRGFEFIHWWDADTLRNLWNDTRNDPNHAYPERLNRKIRWINR